MHKDKGRNFMYSQQGNDKIEELYNGLYKIINAGITRYSPTTRKPETIVSRLLATPNTKISNLEGEYEDSYKKMRGMRNKLGIFAGTRSAAIYVGSAYAL